MRRARRSSASLERPRPPPPWRRPRRRELSRLWADDRLVAVGIFVGRIAPGFVAIAPIVIAVVEIVLAVFDVARLDGRDVVGIGGVDLGQAAVETVIVIVVVIAILQVVGTVVGIIEGTQRGLFLGMCGFLGEQRIAVSLGDLVIIGMDLAESEETVPIAAEIDESGLQ